MPEQKEKTSEELDRRKWDESEVWHGLEPWEAIRGSIADSNSGQLSEVLDYLTPGEVARALTRLTGAELQTMLTLLDPEEAADLVEELSYIQGVDIIEDLPAHHAAAIFDEMESDHRADLLGEMDEDDAEAILEKMDPEEAEDARHLLTYEDDTAGGIMITSFVSYPQNATVGDVLKNIRDNAEKYSDDELQYAYVESEHGTLVGVIRLRDLILSPANRHIRDIMIVNPIYVLADMPIEDLGQFFDRYGFRVVPVTDHNLKLVGIARRGDTEEALGEAQEMAFMRFSGIVGEELRSTPFWERFTRRLAWLGPNLVLSFTAASVMLLFEDTISHFGVALVLFIPVIGNMSGCSGNQAVAVSIREMALGIIEPGDFFRVWLAEVPIGLCNGLLLGAVIGSAATVVGAFFSTEHVSMTIGIFIMIAFLGNTLVAVSLGGIIPLFLRMLRLDPALGSPPILTTLCDMSGLCFLLGLVTTASKLGWI